MSTSVISELCASMCVCLTNLPVRAVRCTISICLAQTEKIPHSIFGCVRVCVCVWNMRLVVCSLVGRGCTLIQLFVVLNKDHLEDFLGSARFVYSRKANKSECTKRTKGKKHMASWRLFCFLWEFSAPVWLNLTLCYDTDQQHRTVLFIWWFLKA